MLNLEDFKKLELKTARVISAEEIPGAAKLLKLIVDIGGEKRQLVAGIKKAYRADELAGRDIVVVVNLEPRAVMGVESNGMLLAADDNGPVLLRPDRPVPPGSRIG
jgi:methionyl-tRNA synthetase